MSIGPTRGPLMRPSDDRDFTEIFQRLEDIERGESIHSAVRVFRNTTQSINNNTLTPVTFTDVAYEFGEWVDLGVDATILTVPDTGFYVVQGQIRWSAAVGGGTRRSFWINLNGSLEVGWDIPNIAGNLTDMNATLSRQLAAGDTLKLDVLQASGAALNIAFGNLSATRV
jgi:hypothetical protein